MRVGSVPLEKTPWAPGILAFALQGPDLAVLRSKF